MKKKKEVKKKPAKKRKKEVKKVNHKTKKKAVKKTHHKTRKKEVKRRYSKKGIERASTGIAGLDKLIQGGFVKNSINLLIGGSGCGKSIFSIQFLTAGIKKKEKVLYITFEEKKNEFYANMLQVGINLEALEKQGYFFFLEYTPEKVRTMLEEGGGAIENIVLTKGITRIVIDSITSFELLFEREIDKREAVLSLFSLLRKWSLTALLTYEGSPFLEKRPTSRVLDFESDAMILVYLLRGKKHRNRLLEVLKMRGTDHSLKTHPYFINNKGITVSTRPATGIVEEGK